MKFAENIMPQVISGNSYLFFIFTLGNTNDTDYWILRKWTDDDAITTIHCACLSLR
jgi:hypothetical protein